MVASVSSQRSPTLAKLWLDLGVTSSQTLLAAVFVLAHIPLAMMMRTAPAFATAHAIASALIGLTYAATTRRIRYAAIAAGYMVGCEVLWRMNKADVFWEFGKYSLVAFLLIGLFRMRRRRISPIAVMYFAFLLPSVALSFSSFDLDYARQEVSFYLSGPLAIAVAAIFMSNVTMSRNELLATFVAIVAPVVGICALSFISTASRDDIEFVNGANFVTSGGFGPNQVSAMLGLAAMLLILIMVERKLTWFVRLPMFALAAALAAQSALTFSRGGIMISLAGLCGAAFYWLRGSRRGRATVLVVGGLGFLLGNYVIEPQLESFTKGKLSARYESTKSSGRELFVASELNLFEENPILGVGPGGGMRSRAERGEFGGF